MVFIVSRSSVTQIDCLLLDSLLLPFTFPKLLLFAVCWFCNTDVWSLFILKRKVLFPLVEDNIIIR